MDFLELAKRRYSCRKFDGARAASKEDIEYCLEAARLAPSACNAQPYRFTVCLGEIKNQAASCLGFNRFATDASHLVIISEESYNISASIGSKIKDIDFRSIDIGIAAAHLTLAAAERNLDSCILGWFDEKRLKELLGIKGRIRLVIAIGYAAAGCAPKEKKRKPMEEIVRIKE
jgi:nitroreductase